MLPDVIAMIVVAMLVYDYNRPTSTTASTPPSSISPTTTGLAAGPSEGQSPLNAGPGTRSAHSQ